jgi:hypothetical protein
MDTKTYRITFRHLLLSFVGVRRNYLFYVAFIRGEKNEMKPLQFIGAKRSFIQEKSGGAGTGSFFIVESTQSNLDALGRARCFNESKL